MTVLVIYIVSNCDFCTFLHTFKHPYTFNVIHIYLFFFVWEMDAAWYEPATLCACLGAASFIFIFLLWLTFPYTCLYRVKMRRKYKLKGSLAEDCAINAFCGWCALCQQYRELDHQGFNVSIGTLIPSPVN
ncbi:putative PLAC8 motif-containing protein [Helianthus annuus]|nr:putative PLAC8 motif-containing protein [Helianthus annuus]